MCEIAVLIKYQCEKCQEKFLLGVQDKYEEFSFYVLCPICGSEEVKGIEVGRVRGSEEVPMCADA